MIEFLRVGKILKSQGIKGEAKVLPTTSDIKRFDNLSKVYLIKDEDNTKDLSSEKEYNITSVKYLKDAVVVKFDTMDKIEDIMKYVGYSLYIKRSEAIKLNQNEYYVADIIGMDVKDIDNKISGKVVDVMESKNNSCLVIDANGKEILIPMAIDYIQNIDISNNIIIIKLIEGILDI